MKKNLLILGYGDHSKVITEIAKQIGYESFKYIDTNLEDNLILKNKFVNNSLPNGFSGDFFIAIGDNYSREKIYKLFKKTNPLSNLVSLIHPKAYISASAQIDDGVCILPMSVVNSNCEICKGALINVNCVIDHNSVIGSFASMSPNSCVGGNVKVGNRTALLISSTVSSGINIGHDAVIGGNSFVQNNIAPLSICIGTPAKRIKFRKPNQKYMN
ncbi:acetyltransferase [Prochlorococcus marinus]|uniref:acetyltransferase n=1 Tax=Prochlorococcus marinus TaxID=1219 RepID=UPI0001900654|nr:acetyltransferase [Prochlorococcus marinus]EEE39319.1 general glycosylation pathway protein [Prochlorococcus marinus str. MIT 9202]